LICDVVRIAAFLMADGCAAAARREKIVFVAFVFFVTFVVSNTRLRAEGG
jgi:hypothetical protein